METFRTAVTYDGMNIEHIHPAFQRNIEPLVNWAKTNPNIKSVIIFGSAVRKVHHQYSDINIYVELDSYEELHCPELPIMNHDMLSNFEVNKYMK